MLPILIPAGIKGLGTYLGGLATKRAQEKAYQQQMDSLLEQQGLETQSANIGMDYEQGLANRGIGDTAAATGMTGSAITQRLGNITGARNEAMRKFAFSQLLQRKQMETDRQVAATKLQGMQRAGMYQDLGKVGGEIASSYFSTPSKAPAKTLAAPEMSTKWNEPYSLPNPFSEKDVGLKSIFKPWTSGVQWGGR